jgi:hypothetical protein
MSCLNKNVITKKKTKKKKQNLLFVYMTLCKKQDHACGNIQLSAEYNIQSLCNPSL